MHPRRAIRNAIHEHVKAGGTGADERVFASRTAPVNVETMLIEQGPVTLVYVRSDTIEKDGYSATGDGAVKRELEVAVEITAAGDWVVDDRLDDLAEEVETLLEAFDIPGFPAAELRLQSSEIDAEVTKEAVLGGVLLIFTCCYWKVWRPEPEEAPFPCPTDIGVKVNGGPREAWPLCECLAP